MPLDLTALTAALVPVGGAKKPRIDAELVVSPDGEVTMRLGPLADLIAAFHEPAAKPDKKDPSKIVVNPNIKVVSIYLPRTPLGAVALDGNMTLTARAAR